jgi:hypothetical protein
VRNSDASTSNASIDGRQITLAKSQTSNATLGKFFTEHSMNTGNTVRL